MIKKGVLAVIMFISITAITSITANASAAKDITFSVNQTDYYFKTGENAIIPLNIENTYGKEINGMLTYTYTQEINQGGMYMFTSNSQSTSFSIKNGKTTEYLNFGTSNTPSELNVNLKFTYTEKEQRVVNLNGIKIHFVSNENQKQNRQNKISSSSKKASSQQTQSSGQGSSQIQQQFNQMMNNQQTKQALENYQMAQDTSALKKQIENQIKKQEDVKQEFQKQLFKNQKFQKEHQKFLNKGYKLTNINVNPSSNNTGDFALEYKNKNGDKASLKGYIENGKITNLQKDSPEIRQEMLNKLKQNKQFQEYQNQLQKQGYSQQRIQFSQEQNKTHIKINYANKDNKTANITADIINNTVKNVKIHKSEKEKQNWWILVLLVLLLVFGYFAYKRLKKKEKQKTVIKEKRKETFDYKTESIKLLEESKRLFKEKKYKDAYATAGQALRLFLTYKNKLNKELTNDEIINYLKNHKQEYKEAKECLDLCSLVEFAKYKPNKEDFDKIINYAEKIIKFNHEIK